MEVNDGDIGRTYRKFRNWGVGLFGGALLLAVLAVTFQKDYPDRPDCYSKAIEERVVLEDVESAKHNLQNLLSYESKNKKNDGLINGDNLKDVNDSIKVLDGLKEDIGNRDLSDSVSRVEKYEQDFWRIKNENNLTLYSFLLPVIVCGVSGLYCVGNAMIRRDSLTEKSSNSTH
ncbi:hypothetical protein GOV12_05435 [Candidatus Pacearchaeota archaeon]|nr:hypothetical protein [Candidatus Pacearchaeota archaeon]